MLELQNISKKYEGFLLEGINLQVATGEFLALLGPSGCGKSTLLKIMAGLITDFQGELLIKKRKLREIPVKERRISMVFQEALLFPHLNVAENVAFGLKMQGVAKKLRMQKAADYLELLELPGYGARAVDTLSGGQKQRVALARALVMEPEILLLDEPLSALDFNLRQNLQGVLKKLHRQKKLTTIFVTHDREEAFYLADRIGILEAGRLKQLGTAAAMLAQPQSAFVASFLGERNILAGDFLAGGLFRSREFSLPTSFTKTGAGYLLIPNQAISITQKAKNSAGEKTGEIVDHYIRNGLYHWELLVEGERLTYRNSQLLGDWGLGEQVGVQLDPHQVLYLAE